MTTKEDIARVQIGVAELGLTAGATMADVASALLRQQQESWAMLRNNYELLARVHTREFRIDGTQVRVQFNPGRLTSSAAKVDDRSIRERACFLCAANLPPEQRGVLYADRFIILVNPFPIFPDHFTIPRIEHVPQRIVEELGTFLVLARDLAPRYSVFYNGARCGASAPDHLHFQAGTRSFMPLEEEYGQLRTEKGRSVRRDGTAEVIAIEGGGRRFVAVEGTNAADVERAVAGYCDALQRVTGEPGEAMMNLIAWFNASSWTVLVFPRTKHRPSFYAAEGEERLLISPAAVDLGGVSITPLEADFHKVTATHLAGMYEEVGMTRAKFFESLH